MFFLTVLVVLCVFGVMVTGCTKENGDTSAGSQTADAPQEKAQDTEEEQEENDAEGTEGTEMEKTLESADDDYTVRTIEDQGFNVTLRVTETDIEVSMQADTKGWVAIGFDPSSMMKDANFIIGYVKDGEVFLRDDFGVSTINHKPDTSLGGESNVTVIGGEETEKGTSIQFRIPMDSNDQYDTVLERGKEYTILLAFGNDDDFDRVHRRHTKVTVTL